ncbi:DUF6958 family protein [Flavicella marina]|uniref:DUF6958 family protein n=1 Tax=Flavicella marina TaxID=1475951 RepID=UPI00126436A8|nr:hypothetical protein [Flavicella marina]
MKEEKITTLHPKNKNGVRISKLKYEVIKEFILTTLQQQDEIQYKDLNTLANESLKNSFDGSISWYIVTVKLDLEARNIIERIPNTSPHKIRLKR